MDASKEMDIENQGVEFNENNVVIQDDKISYEDAYTMNGAKLVSMPTLVEIIALVLGVILKETDKFEDNHASGFTAKSVPSISIKDYLKRIATCSHCSDECLILALIYIDRITERNKSFIIKSLNIHR